MVDNQHRLIKGYKELSEEEIKLMNLVKGKAEEVNQLLAKLNEGSIDQRWLSIGRTNLQQGFMAVTRAITKPDFF